MRGKGADEDDERQTAALMGCIVILLWAIVGVVLVRQLAKAELAKQANLEGCLMSGRRNRAPIELPLRP